MITFSTNADQVAARLAAKQRELRLVMHRALEEVGDEAIRQYGRPVSTWSKKPQFVKEIDSHGPEYELLVGTDDRVFNWVDEGTRPHVIKPRGPWPLRFMSGFHPKTTPGSMQAGQGGSFGSQVTARGVNHPGGKPRRFTEQVQKIINRFGPKVFRKRLRVWAK